MLRIRSRRIAVVLMLAIGLLSCGSSNDGASDVSPDEGLTPADSTTATTTADTATATANSAPTAGADDSLEEALVAFVGDTPGGVDVLLKRDGDTRRSAGGVGSDAGDALVPGSAFRVGSVSKPFVATMVLQLVDEGVVELDTPLGDYLPATAVGADTTIRQLLSHQSGIRSYTDQPAFFNDVLADTSQRYTPADILAYVAEAPLGQPDQFAYSNTNYILLGQLIETLDGTDLNTSLSTRITDPLALENTVFDTGEGQQTDRLVAGWSPGILDGDPTAPYDAIASSAWAAGSLLSTTDDLAAFLEALAAGELTSAESLAAMTDFGPNGYGFGLFQAGFSATQTGFGHNGSIPGYSSTMAIDPATGDTLVILTNNDALIADRLAQEILIAE